MIGTEVPNPRCSSACDCTCVLTRNQSLSRDSLMLAICFIVQLFSLANYTLLFVSIERQGHSVHMSSVLQVQHLYTAGIPLLEAYLLPMANN